jgi:hypothetical protein
MPFTIQPMYSNRSAGSITTRDRPPDGTTTPAGAKASTGPASTSTAVADNSSRQLLCVLGIGTLSTVIPDRPCPWCGAELRIHQPVDEPSTVTCSTGSSCTVPVGLDDRGRRVWNWHDLAQLAQALDAAERRVS